MDTDFTWLVMQEFPCFFSCHGIDREEKKREVDLEVLRKRSWSNDDNLIVQH